MKYSSKQAKVLPVKMHCRMPKVSVPFERGQGFSIYGSFRLAIRVKEVLQPHFFVGR